MQLSSFPAFGLKGLLDAKEPPIWALSVLEDTIVMLRTSADEQTIAHMQKEIDRIEQELADRFSN